MCLFVWLFNIAHFYRTNTEDSALSKTNCVELLAETSELEREIDMSRESTCRCSDDGVMTNGL